MGFSRRCCVASYHFFVLINYLLTLATIGLLNVRLVVWKFSLTCLFALFISVVLELNFLAYLALVIAYSSSNVQMYALLLGTVSLCVGLPVHFIRNMF